MKTLESIISQTPIFLHNWNSKFGVIADFEGIYMDESQYNAEVSPYANVQMWESDKAEMAVALEKWKSINVLFASYGTDNYSGDAFVLFEKDGNLFEVNAGHCSCYGLENQFEPEEAHLEALKHRLLNGRLGHDEYCDNVFFEELKQFLGIETT